MALPTEIRDAAAVAPSYGLDKNGILEDGWINDKHQLLNWACCLIGVNCPAGGSDEPVVIIDLCFDKILGLLSV